MGFWPRDRFDLAARLIQYWWAIVLAWSGATVWIFSSIQHTGH